MSLKRAVFGCALLAAVSAPVWAETAADGISVEGAYVRAVPPGQVNSAAFMSLHNGGSQAHALVAARSSAAANVELHAHTMRDGMMRMRPVEKIDLPAGQAVTLQPGGLHLMLIGLPRSLVVGEDAVLTLVFEDGSEQAVNAPVQKINVEAMQHQPQHR